jgi:predicted nucleic acid-binding protein
MSVVALYDANALYPSTLRDLLIRIFHADLARPRWSHRILDECFAALHRNRPDIPVAALERLRRLMIAAVRDCMVENYEELIPALTLPDPDDRHVLAAAIRADAKVIVTANLRDFPDSALRPWQITAVLPDDFLLERVGADRAAVWECVEQIAASRRRPPETPEDVLTQLERCGAGKTAAALRARE